MTSIAPGMEQVVEAGETLVIQDENGQRFAVVGREAQETMRFFRYFDDWFVLHNGNVKGPIIDTAWYEVKKAYEGLPSAVKRELPSFRSVRH